MRKVGNDRLGGPNRPLSNNYRTRFLAGMAVLGAEILAEQEDKSGGRNENIGRSKLSIR
jgi:hypothetical protein